MTADYHLAAGLVTRAAQATHNSTLPRTPAADLADLWVWIREEFARTIGPLGYAVAFTCLLVPVATLFLVVQRRLDAADPKLARVSPSAEADLSFEDLP